MSEFKSFTARVRTLECGEMDLECTPDNTVLYLHHPERSVQYDHFFYQLRPDELPDGTDRTRNFGAFLTAHCMGEEMFESLVKRVTDSCEWKVIFCPDPLPSDKEAIDSQIADIFARELDDIDPSDFM